MLSQDRTAQTAAPAAGSVNGMDLADALEELVGDWATPERVSCLGVAADEVYGHHLLTQLLVRRHLKQVLFAQAVVGEYRAERHLPALALTRPVLEGAVQLSWAAAVDQSGQCQLRMERILAAGLEEMAATDAAVPAFEGAFLSEARRRNLKKPPSTRQAMRALDARERRRARSPFWESHYEQYGIASRHLHASFLGPGVFRLRPDGLVLDPKPDDAQGVAALRWCLFYFALATDAITRMVALKDMQQQIADSYDTLRPLAQSALDSAAAPANGATT